MDKISVVHAKEIKEIVKSHSYATMGLLMTSGLLIGASVHEENYTYKAGVGGLVLVCTLFNMYETIDKVLKVESYIEKNIEKNIEKKSNRKLEWKTKNYLVNLGIFFVPTFFLSSYLIRFKSPRGLNLSN